MTMQRTEGEGKVPEHTHEALVHIHDHYHIAHFQSGGILGEWAHRSFWHTHEHNHNVLVHSHDYEREEEDAHHGREAHVHDHASPTRSPA